MRIHRSSPFIIRYPRCVLILLSLFLIGWFGGWSRLIQRGNAHYEAGEYDAAREAYQSAATERPEASIPHYNLGTALYRQQRFDEAGNEFRRSLDTKDSVLQAQAYYNLGNTQFQSGDMEGTIRSYKSALRLNPTDLDAKYNLELALEKLVQQQSQQQNQSDSGNSEQDGQEQNQQNEDDTEEQQQDQQNPESSEQDAPETKSEESSPTPEQDSTQQPDEMSKEDAIRLLEAFKDDEKEIQKQILRKRFSKRQRQEKDW
ncbi:MAG: tetratricopeptide repeat protein [Candidatus Poribacteria bacterium]|nr:tetratricopeptide repeat protein [Candidatus Poribacteria bacterium]